MAPEQPENYRYVILGSGRQGTAAAYDLARFGGASQIIMADRDPVAAEDNAHRVNRLTGREVAQGVQLDATDLEAVREVLSAADGAISAVPYYFNLDITRAAIAAGTHLADLGGNAEVVSAQLELDDQARDAHVSVVPDCGMGPGLISTLVAYLVELLDEPREVIIYDGGLPQDPQPPWNYKCTFHINGLTNEYYGYARFIRGGKPVQLESLSDMHLIDYPGIGQLEAMLTSGGMATAAQAYLGTLERLENYTLRYPGHYQWFRAFQTLGLFEEEPIQVGDQQVVPREVYHTLLAPHISAPLIKDVCLFRGVGVGVKDGAETRLNVDIIDYYDEETGFTAMERLTGWHIAIMLGFQVRGAVPPGCHGVESAVKASDFMEALRLRGIDHTITAEPS